MKIGIDLGGSHIGVGLINDEGNIILKKETDILEKDKNNIHTFLEEKIIKFIKEILKEEKIDIEFIDMIGIACPGTVNKTTIIKSVNLNIENFNIEEMINKYFNTKVILRNDGKCAGIAEKKFGALKDYNNSIFMCIGTGIGGAVFMDNKLLEPSKFPGFEFGHIIIDKQGNLCKCGKHGCFETYASMRVLKRNLAEGLDLEPNVTGEEILKIVKENLSEDKVQNILDDYIENLSIGISNLINLFEPDAIAIGGSFAMYDEILIGKLEKKLKKGNLLFNKTLPQFKLANLKNDAGMIGAVIDYI